MDLLVVLLELLIGHLDQTIFNVFTVVDVKLTVSALFILTEMVDILAVRTFPNTEDVNVFGLSLIVIET